MKLTAERPFANPEAAARKLLKLAAGIEPVQDSRIHIEKINAPFLYTLKASGPEFGAGSRGLYARLLNARRGPGIRECWRPYRRTVE